MSRPKRVSLSKRAAKGLPGIPRKFREAIQAALEELALNPLLGIALQPPLEGRRRYRVADYRIVYEFDETTLFVLSIQHRKDVYR